MKIQAVGICGSDLHLFECGRSGDYVVRFPFLLGHEAAGEIVEVGEGVTGFKVGQKVALEPGIPCGSCSHCMEGNYNLCPDIRFLSAPPYDGVFCEYVAHPASRVFLLPPEMSVKQGAMIEPLAVAMHAVRQSGVREGGSAVVLGLGCIGQLVIAALRNIGVTRIFAADLLENRRRMAMELGAMVFDTSTSDGERLLSEAVGDGCSAVFETAGNPYTTARTVSLARPGGTIVLVGMIDKMIPYDFFNFTCKELTIKSVFRYRHLYQTAIEAVAAGRIPLDKIVNREYRFDELDKALNECIDLKTEITKAIVVM